MTDDENKDSNRRRPRFYGGVYPGVYLLVVGIIFLLNSLGYLHGDAWGKLWPVFIIIPALFMIFRSRRS
jgi:hypothetical protein